MIALMDMAKWALRTMKVMPEVVKEVNTRLYRSETPRGSLYWLDTEEKVKVAELEANGDKVWHVIKSSCLFDEEKVDLTTYLLFTGEDVADFERARSKLLSDIGKTILTAQDEAALLRTHMAEHLKDGICFSYTVNETWLDCSEYGDVVIVPRNGGIARVG